MYVHNFTVRYYLSISKKYKKSMFLCKLSKHDFGLSQQSGFTTIFSSVWWVIVQSRTIRTNAVPMMKTVTWHTSHSQSQLVMYAT